MSQVNANGKFLITGEYYVLYGAKSLATPLTLGQSLTINPIERPFIECKSFDNNGLIWFEAKYDLYSFQLVDSTDKSVSSTFRLILLHIKKRKPTFFISGISLTFRLDFNRFWGLGTSSTLVSLMCQWANLDPFVMQFEIFNGSAYDIACATAQGPLIYSLENQNPTILPVDWYPSFRSEILFVYTNQKMNSRDSLKKIANIYPSDHDLDRISSITETLVKTNDILCAINIFEEHESIVADWTGFEKIKLNPIFCGFIGTVKSLGAWGGDFVLALSPLGSEYCIQFFKERGFHTFFSYDQIILNKNESSLE